MGFERSLPVDVALQQAGPQVEADSRQSWHTRIREWRDIVPDIAIRSSFVVGFPGETEDDVKYLLDWLEEARLDRVGAFRFEPVEGAAANALPDHVPEEVKQERFERVMALSARISAEQLAAFTHGPELTDKPRDRIRAFLSAHR